ncbi:MAG: zinc ABC transporter substrate-binding protein [Thermodesulfovibrionaceae bacterium]
MLYVFFLTFTACEKKSTESKIYVSCYPLEYFTKLIIKDAYVESIIPTGVDPHHFEPSMRDIQNLYNSKAVIYIGDSDIDRWLDKIKEELKQKGVKVIRLQDKLSLKSYSSKGDIDPHIWLDPIMSLEILKILKDLSLKLNPKNSSEYEKIFREYEKKLIELDSLYRNTLSRCLKRDIIVTHEFLNYLGSRYGFNSYFIVHEPEEEVSLKRIRELKEFMRKNSITYIITEPEGEIIAKALSEETKAKILNFDTFHRKTEKDYIEVMKENLVSLKTALNCIE